MARTKDVVLAPEQKELMIIEKGGHIRATQDKSARKKVGGAVQRNRARRIIRQAYRETESMFPTGLDLVIVALPSIVGISSTKLRDYLAGSGLSRIRRWMEPPSEGGKPD